MHNLVTAQSRDCAAILHNLVIGTQFQDSEIAQRNLEITQRNLEITQIPKLRRTNTHTVVYYSTLYIVRDCTCTGRVELTARIVTVYIAGVDYSLTHLHMRANRFCLVNIIDARMGVVLARLRHTAVEVEPLGTLAVEIFIAAEGSVEQVYVPCEITLHALLWEG